MKFGDQLEQTSVPGWSLHNVDYNSLKHQIKAHTTKGQATAAVAIPGQQDYALTKFEDAFYLELCSQHNRVGLFITSKADEISRRLNHLCGLVHELLLKCADARGLSAKRQRRFVKYQAQIEECGRDIKAVGRFVDAQVTAFRKILKKYKKWTGSTTLGSRFKDGVLSNPKSFTNYNFTPLQLQYRDLRTTLEAALPTDVHTSEPPLPSETQGRPDLQVRRNSQRSSDGDVATIPPTYWNEYEHGSEAGDQDDAYVIYIDPHADDKFPGLSYVKNMLGAPVDQVRHWLQPQKPRGAVTASPSETQSLLNPRLGSTAASPTDYFTIGGRYAEYTTGSHNQTTEDEYPSSEDGDPHFSRSLGLLSRHSYSTSSDIEADSKIECYQDRVLTQSIILAFVAAFVLLGVSGLLVVTGRRHLRLEVDAGATLGSVSSLFCACMGLGAILYRRYPAGYLYSFIVWGAFVVVCALNGTLLVLVASRSGF